MRERKFEQLLQRSIDLLPKDNLSPENGAVRAVVGIHDKADDPQIQKGVYRLTEVQTRENNKYFLVQDTMVVSPLVKGIVIENGIIVGAVGFGRKKMGSIRMIKSARNFMEGFLACQRYLTI